MRSANGEPCALAGDFVDAADWECPGMSVHPGHVLAHCISLTWHDQPLGPYRVVDTPVPAELSFMSWSPLAALSRSTDSYSPSRRSTRKQGVGAARKPQHGGCACCSAPLAERFIAIQFESVHRHQPLSEAPLTV